MRTIYVIADSHLGGKEGDVAAFGQWLESLDPGTSELICLGDFFHIWAGPQQYHLPQVAQTLALMERFAQAGGICRLVVGNRDVFFRAGKNRPMAHLPFEEIALDFLEIHRGQARLLFTHGDLVNSQDRQYLRWRRLVRSRLFRGLFWMIPAGKVKKIMLDLETKLKNTNQAFRLAFPEEEWQSFLARHYAKQPFTLLAIGHFHPASLKVTPIATGQGLVVPDWFASRQVLVIAESGQFQTQSTDPA